MGVSKLASYADLVRVPRDAFTFKVSAPPNMLRMTPLTYASPSAFPTFVPVFRKSRDFSRTARETSISVGVVDGSVWSGRSTKMDMGSSNISKG